MNDDIQKLASYRKCVEKICSAWPAFLDKRATRLQQQARHGQASEKVAENILEYLFTEVLDWSLGDLNNQLNYADLDLTSFNNWGQSEPPPVFQTRVSLVQWKP